MKTQPTRDELIAGLIEARQEILRAVSRLPLSEQDRVFLGVWSVKDLLAHLEGWDYANLRAGQSVLAGETPEFYAFHDHDWKSYNARLVEQYKKGDLAELMTSVRESHRQLVEYLKTVPEGSFNKDLGVRFKGYKVTIGRLVQAETSDERVHYQQIRDAFSL